MKNFYDTLFNPNEYVCWGKTQFDTKVYKVEDYERYGNAQYFSINPLIETRLDACVTSYRNILCEFDKHSIFEQQKLLKNTELPYSTLTYSGGKSLHAIISLNTPVDSEEYYRALATAIYNKLGGKLVVDVNCKNPSRFSRTPGVFRPNGRLQELLEIKDRVSLQTLKSWIGVEIEEPKRVVEIIGKRRILNGYTTRFLLEGAEDGEWNNTLFKAAIDMFKAGYQAEEVENMVFNINKKLFKDDRSTIKSAQRVVRRAL
jgi:hypothetical protein